MPLQSYDEIAPHYDQGMAWIERWFLDGLRAETLRRLPLNARILEVGAGTGRNFVFYPAGSTAVASEPSREMLRIAESKLPSDGIRLLQSEAERLPFASGSFDAAFATLVFCSVNSPEHAFAEMRRVVKPGGSVVLLEHVRPRGLLGLVFDLISLITVPLFDDHLNRRTSDEARRSGFEVVKVEKRKLGIINLIECRV